MLCLFSNVIKHLRWNIPHFCFHHFFQLFKVLGIPIKYLLFRGPQWKKSRGIRSDNLCGYSIKPFLPNHLFGYVWSRYCRRVTGKWAKAFSYRNHIQLFGRYGSILLGYNAAKAGKSSSLSICRYVFRIIFNNSLADHSMMNNARLNVNLVSADLFTYFKKIDSPIKNVVSK